MFNYSDPSELNFLGVQPAKRNYQVTLHEAYRAGARASGSAFTMLEAMNGVIPPNSDKTASVEWEAYPRTAGQSDGVIDQQRLTFQDEYVEWHSAGLGGPKGKITFTTEFPEYFEAFAEIGAYELTQAIAEIYPGTRPGNQELFGPTFDPTTASALQRRNRFRQFLPSNPYNNGTQGILCLTHGANSLGALVNLLIHCSKPRPDLDPNQVCAAVGGFCGVGRSSDPRISVAAQTLALGGQVLSATDPIGVTIVKLRGNWSMNGQSIDMANAQDGNGANLWQLSRGGRRATLLVPPGLELNGQAVVSGAQVSREVIVAADVTHAPSPAVPVAFRTGNEHLIS